MDSVESALISIRPNYARAILAGTKTVELRRRIPPIQHGTRLWIYATRPLGAVVGSVIVEEIISATPTEIWNTLMGRTALNRSEFDEYFNGTDRALALLLSSVVKTREVGIEELRKLLKGFHPPQVIVRLSHEQSVWLSRRATTAVQSLEIS